MTQDEIIEMADKCGLLVTQQLEAFAKLVAAKEREACVELIKSHGPTLANGFMLTEAIQAKGKA
jgi:hypothetical protein